MGGGTGFQLGLNHADRLDKLILFAPAPAEAGAFLAALERGEVEPSLMVALGALIPAALGRDRDQIAEIARYLYIREPDPAVYNRFVEGVAEAGAGHIGFFDDLATNAALDGDLARVDTPTALGVGLIALGLAEVFGIVELIVATAAVLLLANVVPGDLPGPPSSSPTSNPPRP